MKPIKIIKKGITTTTKIPSEDGSKKISLVTVRISDKTDLSYFSKKKLMKTVVVIKEIYKKNNTVKEIINEYCNKSTSYNNVNINTGLFSKINIGNVLYEIDINRAYLSLFLHDFEKYISDKEIEHLKSLYYYSKRVSNIAFGMFSSIEDTFDYITFSDKEKLLIDNEDYSNIFNYVSKKISKEIIDAINETNSYDYMLINWIDNCIVSKNHIEISNILKNKYNVKFDVFKVVFKNDDYIVLQSETKTKRYYKDIEKYKNENISEEDDD